MKVEQIIAEFIGTFIFVSVILLTGQPIPIAVALLATIFFAGPVSGGHMNPVVSFVSAMKGTIPWTTMAFYIAAQLVAGVCALFWFKAVTRVRNVVVK